MTTHTRGGFPRGRGSALRSTTAAAALLLLGATSLLPREAASAAAPAPAVPPVPFFHYNQSSFEDFCHKRLSPLSDDQLDAVYASGTATIAGGCYVGCVVTGHGKMTFASWMENWLWCGQPASCHRAAFVPRSLQWPRQPPDLHHRLAATTHRQVWEVLPPRRRADQRAGGQLWGQDGADARLRRAQPERVWDVPDREKPLQVRRRRGADPLPARRVPGRCQFLHDQCVPPRPGGGGDEGPGWSAARGARGGTGGFQYGASGALSLADFLVRRPAPTRRPRPHQPLPRRLAAPARRTAPRRGRARRAAATATRAASPATLCRMSFARWRLAFSWAPRLCRNGEPATQEKP